MTYRLMCGGRAMHYSQDANQMAAGSLAAVIGGVIAQATPTSVGIVGVVLAAAGLVTSLVAAARFVYDLVESKRKRSAMYTENKILRKDVDYWREKFNRLARERRPR